MNETRVKTALVLNYLSQAEAEIDIKGVLQKNSVINQRQPVPSGWGLTVVAHGADLQSKGMLTRLEVQAEIIGTSKEKINRWLTEFEKINGVRTEPHLSKDASLKELQAEALEKKAKYEAEKADN